MDQQWRMDQRDLSTEGKWGWGRDKSGQRKKVGEEVYREGGRTEL